MKRSIKLAVALLVFTASSGQDKWDLRQCVDHAVKNNISVRQTDLQSRFSALVYNQSKAAQLPSFNYSGSVGYRLGRSENPTTGVLEDNNFLNIGMQLQAGITVFNWFSRKNTIEASRLSWEADKEQTKKIQNDISLNVAVAYLQILLAREQANLSEAQVNLSRAQLENTRKKVDAGALPELNAAELEAQLARDSSSLVTARAAAIQFLLQLKSLLNLDAGLDFDIATPPVNLIPVDPIASLQPEEVYASAIKFMPQQKINELRILSAKKNTEVAKAELYPSITAFGNLSTSAIYFKRAIYNQLLAGYTSTGARADVNGTYYPVEVPNYIDGSTVVRYYKPASIPKQFNTNFGQSVGVGISVPVFNGKTARTAWERSKVTLQQQELLKEQGDMQLKQDIYKAYNDATAALQKYNADVKAMQTAEKAYSFTSKRYDQNLLSAFELVSSQTNLQKAKIQALYSQYDYVFKMKLLEFYKGQGLKL
ncbi:MAG: TolC family protein [Sphingobacteriales bacterium]|nr:TolC family protein [Sphingobacteriales bacterium]